MNRRLTRRALSRTVDRVARECTGETGNWDWASFDAVVGDLTGLSVLTMITHSLTSGEVSGAALTSSDGSTGVIVIPGAGLEHQIHIACHEAWHLIAGHSGCSEGAGEEEAEEFARLVGMSVKARQDMTSDRWYRLVGVV